MRELDGELILSASDLTGHFLLRVDTPSDLGDCSYEVADTTLARRVKAAALTCCDSWPRPRRICGWRMPRAVTWSCRCER